MPLKLSWLMLRRDFRAGELRLLGIALLIAVASLTSVSFFTDRLGRALTREANQLLGGDLLLIADHPWSEQFATEAGRRGLNVVYSTTFASMASANGRAELSGIKAVQPGYPLRGVLRIAPALNRPDAETSEIPARGTVWLDERLAAALEVKPGEMITLGNSRFTLAAILTFESDRGTNFFSFVPRLMLNANDLEATGLIQSGSRISYRLHLAGEASAITQFQKWAQPKLGRGEQLEDINNARPEVRSALDRAQRFLRLAALLAVVLAAVAIGLAARRFIERHLDGCAVMRCLGARQAQVLGLYFGEFLILGTLVSAFGCGAGFAVQLLIGHLLGDLFPAGLPAPSLLPLAQGFAVGLVLLAGFVAPQLLRLGKVPTLRVLRREWGDTGSLTLAGYGAGVTALAGLMLWIAADWRLGLHVIGGFTAAFALYALAARLLLTAVGGLRGGAVGSGWRYGLASLRRRLGGSVMQAVALGIGITALLLLTVTRDELLNNWRNSVPPDAPNRFIINIQPEQRAAVQALFIKEGLAQPVLLPMVRGRFVVLNGKPVVAADYPEERAQRLVEREFNLSWTTQMPEGNSISAGSWFDPQQAGQPQFSVEQGLADVLGLKLGDKMTFEVAGNRIEAAITSLRKLDWDSMRVNFFVVTPPGVLENFPASYITSFHLPPEQAAVANRLVAALPNLTVIDVAAVLRQLQAMMERLAQAVEGVFIFALLAGFTVLFAALESTHDERQYELAVMRTLGARNSRLRAALAAEFIVLGAVAGLLAGLGATAIGYVLAHYAFKLPYQLGWMTLLAGLSSGIIVTLLAGLWGTAKTLRVPALQSIRALT